jgi:hypothetical protein
MWDHAVPLNGTVSLLPALLCGHLASVAAELCIGTTAVSKHSVR